MVIWSMPVQYTGVEEGPGGDQGNSRVLEQTWLPRAGCEIGQ